MAQSINPVPYDQLPVATAIKSGDQLFVIQDGLFYRISRELIVSKVGDAATLEGKQASEFAPAEIELTDEPAATTIVPIAKKSTKQWFQGIRNNLKALFEKSNTVVEMSQTFNSQISLGRIKQ